MMNKVEIRREEDLDNIDLDNKIIVLDYRYLMVEEEEGYILRDTESFMGGLVGYTDTKRESVEKAIEFFNRKSLDLYIYDNIGDFYINF